MINTHNDLLSDAMDMLAETSRTFYIPISRLVPNLKEAVASAYLCMRAIDEIEDDPEFAPEVKIKLLLGIRNILNESVINGNELASIFQPYQERLPAVTLRLQDWIMLCPPTITPTVTQGTAKMAEGMAKWIERDWNIETEQDLDDYTYVVAGAVGELLSDLWMWYDGTETNRAKAVAFGRGLQAVNITINRSDDLERGVDFFPNHWGRKEMVTYTRRNLELADEYIAELKSGPALDFCKIPLALAHGTLFALSKGKSKLNRATVLEIVKRVTG